MSPAVGARPKLSITARPNDFRDETNCTPINSALSSILIKGQKSSRQLQFDCDEKHEIIRVSLERRAEAAKPRRVKQSSTKVLNSSAAVSSTPRQSQQLAPPKPSPRRTLDDLQDMVVDFS